MDEDPSLITPTIVRHRDDFALEVEKAFQAASLAAATSEIAPNQSQTPQADASRAYPPAGPAPPVETLSASPYQVLHAVQYNNTNPSHSSLESWEQDSVAAPSQSEGSQLGDKAEERAIPPVPQIPSSVQHQQQDFDHRPEPGPAQYASNMAASNGHPGVYYQQPMPPNQQYQQYQQYQQAPMMQASAPPAGTRRSQSLLSAISSAVSDDRAPVSPASSHAGFSRPPSRGYAPQRTSARDSPVQMQIAEEPMSQNQKHFSSESYSGYDLYADHNGVVRGMQDKQGQPLRVKTGQVPDVSPTTSPRSGSTITPKAGQHQAQEDTTRYSFERPMSFVSGPRDESGRPQDEINMPTPSIEKDIPPVPQVPLQHQGHVAHHTPMSSMHKVSPPGSMDARTIRGHPPQSQQLQQPHGTPMGRQADSSTQIDHSSQHGRTQSRSTVSPPPLSQASPPPQPSPPPTLSQRLPLQNGTGPPGPPQDSLPGPRMQNGSPQDPRVVQDPRMQGVPPQDPRPSQDSRTQAGPPQNLRVLQDPSMQTGPQDPRVFQDPRLPQDPKLQGASPQEHRMQQLRAQDPRAQGIPSRQESIDQENRLRANPEMSGALGHPPTEDPRLQMQIPPGQVFAQDPRLQTQTGTPTSPRNMYEQTMQQRTNSDPRMQGAGFQHQNGASTPPAAAPQAKPEEKSRKLSSMFNLKGFGLKSLDKAEKAGKAQQPTPPAPSGPQAQPQAQSQLQHQRQPQFQQQPQSLQQNHQQPQPQANGQMRTQQLADQPQLQQQHAQRPQQQQHPQSQPNVQMRNPQSVEQPQQQPQQQYQQQRNGQMRAQQLTIQPPPQHEPQPNGQVRPRQLPADASRLVEPTRSASIQPQQQSNGQIRTQQTAADASRLGEPTRSASVQSGVSGISALPSEQTPARRPEGRPATTASVAQSHRQSIAESEFSHVTQDSTQVQAAESRLDLRHPASPPPGRGIPPRQPSTGAPAPQPQGQQVPPQVQQLPPQSQVPALAQPPMQGQQQPQPFRMHSAGVPEFGKKKRTSLFGTIFGRNSTANHADSQKPPKLSKEEKKAQKAQKQNGTPPPAMQRPPTQQWPPPQQQQPMRPGQTGMQYGPPPMGRPFPGMGRPVQGMPPQGTFPQGIPPQGQVPYGHPLYQQPQGFQQQQMPGQRPFPNGVPQQYQQPQGVPPQMMQTQIQMPNGVPMQFTHPQLQQQQMLRMQQQMAMQQALPQGTPQQYAPAGNFQKPQIQTQQPAPTGSAYNDTRQIAQAHSPQQGPPTTNGAITPAAIPRPSIEQRSETSSPAPPAPPLDGYFKPDDKKGPMGQMNPDLAMDQQLPSSQRPSQRRAVQQPQQQPQESLMTSPTSPDSAVTVIADQQHQLSDPIEEPQYDTPQIPAAYTPVHGPYVSPSTNPSMSDSHLPPISQRNSMSGRQDSDPHMQTISPQISNLSQTAPHPRSQSDASVVSALSPVSDPSPGPPTSQPTLYQKVQKSRMTSITEQSQHERPWNVDLPPGATEQEIIQARHQQYMKQQFAAQQQLHAERSAQSPSPHLSRHTQSPSPRGTTPAQQQNQQAQQPVYQGHTYASPPPQQVRQSPDQIASPQQQPESLEQVQSYPQEVFHKQQQFYEQQEVPQTLPAGSQNQQQTQHQPQQDDSDQREALQPRYNSPPKQSTTPQQPQGGFREVLPRSSPQPYAVSEQQGQATLDTVQEHSPTSHHTPSPQLPLQPAPIHPNQAMQPSLYPLPTSPPAGDIKSPVNPQINFMPPPPLPSSPPAPIGAGMPTNNTSPLIPQQQHGVDDKEYGPPPPPEQHDYEDQAPDEPPPSYEGPGIENEGMDKAQPHRPPNLLTDAELRGRERDPRSRQPSIGILQHPQPASMAASPQRSQADMGADVLRRQLLQQEERERMERLQRAEQQRAESERERQERERARARARELERSVSGGGRVGSLRSVAGSRAARSGWERRGETSTMPVFELPAEDDEPVMRATSFPGQEWVPSFTDD